MSETGVRERRGRVENHLHAILSELDANTMETSDRIEVEKNCIRIYSAFGGDDFSKIYRSLDKDGGEVV